MLERFILPPRAGCASPAAGSQRGPHCAYPATAQARGWSGCILTNPNCTSTGLTVALKALQDSFGLKRVFVVSLQALSGAGYPGVPSLDIIDNVVPYIGGEEEKVEWEPRKMLGKLVDSNVELTDTKFSAHTNRVGVADGHTVCASVELDASVSPKRPCMH